MQLVPLVSIVMGTYNGKEYLKQQMHSLLAQTYSSLEFIINDDLSTDGTYEILKDYAAKDSRIKLLQNHRNVGYNLNFEQAMKRAEGEYIAIADQDDIWEEEKIQHLMGAWHDEELALLHSPSALFKTGSEIDWKSVSSRVPFRGTDVRKFFIYNHISGHNMLFRRSLLEQALPFPGGMYYDWWLAAVACCNGGIGYVDKVLAYHRLHDTNASGFSEKFIPFYKHVLETLPVLLTIRNLPQQAKKFGEQLLERYKALEQAQYSFRLHLFILTHARIIFSFKKKRFPFFSYLKHSARISSSTFLRKEH
jgi:glycosyltransferase involved in cell wall biosynthesis